MDHTRDLFGNSVAALIANNMSILCLVLFEVIFFFGLTKRPFGDYIYTGYIYIYINIFFSPWVS